MVPPGAAISAADVIPSRLAAQATILGTAGLAGTPRLDFEAWTAFLRTSRGNQPDVIDPRLYRLGATDDRMRPGRG
jgi:hypothetical protein